MLRLCVHILREGSALRTIPGWGAADMQGICSMMLPLATPPATLGIGNARGAWRADSERNSKEAGVE